MSHNISPAASTLQAMKATFRSPETRLNDPLFSLRARKADLAAISQKLVQTLGVKLSSLTSGKAPLDQIAAPSATFLDRSGETLHGLCYRGIKHLRDLVFFGPVPPLPIALKVLTDMVHTRIGMCILLCTRIVVKLISIHQE